MAVKKSNDEGFSHENHGLKTKAELLECLKYSDMVHEGQSKVIEDLKVEVGVLSKRLEIMSQKYSFAVAGVMARDSIIGDLSVRVMAMGHQEEGL